MADHCTECNDSGYDLPMTRWEPDAKGRLQQAAMTLFLERGYAEVTVADIAGRAGLTKRSFFNHFADKREVLFAGSEAFQRVLTDTLAALDPATESLDAAIAALTQAGLSLAGYGQFAAVRRELIASSRELQERDLVKMAALSMALEDGLLARGTTPRAARFTAHAAIVVFNAAYDDWTHHPDADFAALMDQALDDLRTAIER
jgi:AcrR family transcriptional regulator